MSQFNPELYGPSTEVVSEREISQRYYAALRFEEPTVYPRAGGYGLKAEKMLALLDEAVKLPNAADFIEKLAAEDLSFSPQGQAEGFARLARYFGDWKYLEAGLSIAEPLDKDSRLAALSKLMKACGEIDPDKTKYRLNSLVDDTDPHKRFLEAGLALAADNIDILDRSERRAYAFRQLDEVVGASDTLRLGFVGPFTNKTVGHCLRHSRLIIECGR